MNLEPNIDNIEKSFINLFDDLEQETEEVTDKNVSQNTFPVDVFPQEIQKIIKATNDSLKFPIDFIGASILYAASVAIGNTYEVKVKEGWTERAVLYLAIVGHAGTNKSHPLSYALEPLDQRDKKKYKDYLHEKEEYDLVNSLTKKEREVQGYNEPTPPEWEQSLVSDSTPEALASAHSSNERGLGLYFDELASWFKNFNRYNQGSEEQFWLSVWSGKPIRINRKTSDPIYLGLPFLSVIGTIQPGVLNELAYNRTENGFLDRLLFVMPEDLKKEYWSESELSPSITESWHGIISTLLELEVFHDDIGSIQPRTMRFTHDARDLLFKWQRELADDSNDTDNEIIKGINAKIEVYAPRLALILELMYYACGEGNKDSIGVKAIKGALKLAEYFKRAAIQVHFTVSNPIHKIPEDKKILYDTLPDEFTTGEGLKISKSMHISESTFKRFLNDRMIFKKVKHGTYEKLF